MQKVLHDSDPPNEEKSSDSSGTAPGCCPGSSVDIKGHERLGMTHNPLEIAARSPDATQIVVAPVYCTPRLRGRARRAGVLSW